MKDKYKEKLIKLVDELFKKSRYLLEREKMEDVVIASDISFIKGYIEALEEKTPKE